MQIKETHVISLDRPIQRRSTAPSDLERDSAPMLLDVFVVGAENAPLVDFFSLKQLEQLPAVSPVYLFGPHGVGKTSLAASIAKRYVRANGEGHELFINAGDFAKALATAIESDDMDRFRKRFRECDLLVVDSLQDIAVKPSAQEELIHTLDSLEHRHVPVVMTATTLPSMIRGLLPALVSRCWKGLSLEIQFPGPDARREILKLLVKSLSLSLSLEDLERLAIRLPDQTSAPELYSILLKWMHQERMERSTTAAASASSIEQIIQAKQQSLVPSVNDITKWIAKEMGLKMSDLRGTTRKSQVVRGRALAMFVARQVTPLSLQQIGEYFGGRDHTTVLHACRKTEVDLESDIELSRVMQEVRRRLKN